VPSIARITAPAGVRPSDGYAHVVTGRGRLAAIAGQMAFDEEGTLIGAGDPVAQARQVFRNLSRCLTAVGAGVGDLIKLTYYLTDIAHVAAVLAVRDEFVPVQDQPASTVVQVVALFQPDLLLEVDALVLVQEVP